MNILLMTLLIDELFQLILYTYKYMYTGTAYMHLDTGR